MEPLSKTLITFFFNTFIFLKDFSAEPDHATKIFILSKSILLIDKFSNKLFIKKYNFDNKKVKLIFNNILSIISFMKIDLINSFLILYFLTKYLG